MADREQRGASTRTGKAVCDGAPCDVTVELTGNHRIPSAQLFASMRVLVEPEFDTSTLDTDQLTLQGLYYDQGFLTIEIPEPKVEWSDDRRTVRILYQITEGGQYRITRLHAFEDRAAGRCPPAGGWSTRVHAGDVFDRRALMADLRRLQRLYRDQGYANATAYPETDLDPQRHEVAIEIPVIRGAIYVIGHVRISGNEHASEDDLRKRVEIASGARFSETALDRTKERLQETGLFERVDISTEEAKVPGIIDIDIEVTERFQPPPSTRRASPGDLSGKLAAAPPHAPSPTKALDDASPKAFDDPGDTRGCEPIPAPLEIGVRHILIAYSNSAEHPPSVTRTREEARRLAQDILQKIRNGATFDEMLSHTDEPGGVERKGDLGVFSRNVMVETFTTAAFALHVGEISEVVETRYGFHIILRTQ